MSFRAAFYKGTRPGSAGHYNRVMREWHHSPYSHVELAFSDGTSAASSFEDAGVRFKQINYTSGDWDFVQLPDWMEAHARRWFENNREWVTSAEAAAAALGIPDAYRFDIGSLHAVLTSALLTVRTPTFINIEFSKP